LQLYKLGVKIYNALQFIMVINPAQVTSKHKHRCCPCPKWAIFVYSWNGPDQARTGQTVR